MESLAARIAEIGSWYSTTAYSVGQSLTLSIL